MRHNSHITMPLVSNNGGVARYMQTWRNSCLAHAEYRRRESRVVRRGAACMTSAVDAEAGITAATHGVSPAVAFRPTSVGQFIFVKN